MKRWKAILEEYNYELKYKPKYANPVADAVSRIPVQANALTATVHSAEQHFSNYKTRYTQKIVGDIINEQDQ